MSLDYKRMYEVSDRLVAEWSSKAAQVSLMLARVLTILDPENEITDEEIDLTIEEARALLGYENAQEAHGEKR